MYCHILTRDNKVKLLLLCACGSCYVYALKGSVICCLMSDSHAKKITQSNKQKRTQRMGICRHVSHAIGGKMCQ